MYKNKLQVMCQRLGWKLPEYTTVKDGPDHKPSFTAVVNVNGGVFEATSKWKKDAQNAAAQVAFEHFDALALNPVPTAAVAMETKVAVVPPILPVSAPQSSLTTSSELLATTSYESNRPASTAVLKPDHEDIMEVPIVYRTSIGVQDVRYKDTLHIYKNRLQQYAQKKNLGIPVYTCETEGPPHIRRFKSRVCVDGISYESVEFFTTLKEAEQAAAKIACQVLAIDAIQEDGGLYKNLLQEYAQKKGLFCPTYETVRSGMPHQPLFVSTVEVGTYSFHGAEAKTKKLAEMNAAKVAYYAVIGSSPATESSTVSSVSGCTIADSLKQNIEPTARNKHYQDSMDEEAEKSAKRAKTSSKNVIGNTHPPQGQQQPVIIPSDDSSSLSSQVELSIVAVAEAEPISAKPVAVQVSTDTDSVICPQNLSLPIQNHAPVMPHGDHKLWAAYLS